MDDIVVRFREDYKKQLDANKPNDAPTFLVRIAVVDLDDAGTIEKHVLGEFKVDAMLGEIFSWP